MILLHVFALEKVFYPCYNCLQLRRGDGVSMQEQHKTKMVVGLLAAVIAVGATLCAAVVKTQNYIGDLLGDMSLF